MFAGAGFGWQRDLEYKRQHELDQLMELITTSITVESSWDAPAQSASPDEN